jgi:chromatin segregation and condensation protein Rec8/ScpA/Scc1 (kleisin family)
MAKRPPRNRRKPTTDDKQAALVKRLNEPPKPDGLKARFEAAHKQGMESLKSGDYVGVGRAIEAEKAVIDEQAKRIADFAARVARSRKASKR